MDVNITLETENHSNFEISNVDEEGMCLICIEQENKTATAIVSIEELKIALRKITTK